MSVKERKVKKMPVGEKCPLKTGSARGKKITENLKMRSIAKHLAMGWAESIKWL